MLVLSYKMSITWSSYTDKPIVQAAKIDIIATYMRTLNEQPHVATAAMIDVLIKPCTLDGCRV